MYWNDLERHAGGFHKTNQHPEGVNDPPRDRSPFQGLDFGETPYLALKRQAVQRPPFQGGGGGLAPSPPEPAHQ